jgi:spermidine/putrescine-binding protein
MDNLIDKLKRAGIVRVDERGLVHMRGVGPQMTRRHFAGTVLGAAAATTLPGIKSARAATEVNFIGWQGYEEGLAYGGLLDEHDLSINPTYMNDNNQIIATATGGGMGNMDIATPDHGYTPVMAEIGILEPLDIDRIPNFENLFDFFKTMPGPNVDGVQYALPYTWGSIPLMYNPAVVTEKPTSWLDIMKPEYKGKVALVNDVISVMIPFIMTAANTMEPTRVTQDQLDAAIDLIIKVKTEHARTIASGYGELADLFASGEIVMAQAWEPVAAWAAAKGVELEWVIPKEGTWTLVDCLAIIKDAPHMDEAYTLLNNGLTGPAQAHVANVNTTGATVKRAVPLLEERARSMYPYDDIAGYFESSGGPIPLWPLDEMGDFVTFDDVLSAWERFLKA